MCTMKDSCKVKKRKWEKYDKGIGYIIDGICFSGEIFL